MEPEFEPEIELVDLPGHIWDALMTRALSGESFVSNDEVVPDQTDDPTTTDDGTDYGPAAGDDIDGSDNEVDPEDGGVLVDSPDSASDTSNETSGSGSFSNNDADSLPTGGSHFGGDASANDPLGHSAGDEEFELLDFPDDGFSPGEF
ncbi:hypothetical protein CRES_0397 [Corynebacterium resistens DSM 45100]|uniref:Uncharacterized protein n=1 Tax=Corynebacterium resistens (strain DSM 45100 / JCM 12819 / GTC 2026 / SICGH 158) TaxID=662755 RepID=F8DXW3_CORRG|nr:hypothetical protein [Corynebacterium resistens]AEI08760.1 hypothetical protein CRES_0397 [Corynebacterium resistens DSM 45100]